MLLVSCSKIWGTEFLDDPEVRSAGGAPAAGGSGGAAPQGGVGNDVGGSSVGGAGGVALAGGSGGVGGDDNVCSEGETTSCYEGDSATAGVGRCLWGTRTCDSLGQWGPCENQVLPGSESCDPAMVDEDCDGAINEDGTGCVCVPGAPASCYTGPEGTDNVGKCASGTETCAADGLSYGPCIGQVTPSDQEECPTTQIDDNCNGVENEGCACPESGDTQSCYSGAAGTEGQGPCIAGTQTCEDDGNGGTEWSSACAGEVVPGIEDCINGADDDCDGETDLADTECICVPMLVEPCGATDVGACEFGTRICAIDGKSWGDCVGEVLPTTEQCSDTLDTDCNGQVGSGGWQIHTVDTGDTVGPDTADVGRGSSLGIDASGKVWISYLDDTNLSNKKLRVAYKPGNLPPSGPWVTSSPSLASAVTSSRSALAVHKNSGQVWVAYHTDVAGKLWLMSNTSTGWSAAEAVETVGVHPSVASLRVDVSENVWISYRKDTNVYVEQRTAAGVWTNPFYAGAGLTSDTSLSVDHGEVWFSYDKKSGQIQGKQLVVAKQVPLEAWEITDVGPAEGGEHNSIALSAPGEVWVSHHNSDDGDLYVANLSDEMWLDEPVDASNNNVGRYSSLAVDSHGGIWVSYYDVTDKNLKVAHRTPGPTGAWGSEVVDGKPPNGGQVGAYTSIGVDPSDGIWVSYYDESNGNLKVAYNCP